jgi:hypothetical protein
MSKFSINLSGRIKNFDLPKQKPLIPLFEAIMNSIYAIEERQEKEDFQGIISIEIVREDQEILPLKNIKNDVNAIIGFSIIDNGVGFDNNNMKSFLQSDSTYRAKVGGKGIGRFSWLKAFPKVQIESKYQEDNIWVKRQFEFNMNESEIDDEIIEIEEQQDNCTIVKLIDYILEYRKNVPKSGETIADNIMHHFFKHFISKRCPQITIIDGDNKFSLNIIFNQIFKRKESNVSFKIKEESFSLINAEVADASLGGSKLYLFACDRMVLEIDLDKEIVDLDKKIFRDKGYYYVGVLSSSYLDERVNSNRTDFDIPEEPEKDEISLEEIKNNTTTKIREHLQDYLKDVFDKKMEEIRTYIRVEAPQYRHLLRYMSDEIAAIKPTITGQKLDEELYRIKRKFDTKLKQDNQAILENIKTGAIFLDNYQQMFDEQIGKISDANKSNLTEYVAHRRIILELVKHGIKANEFGKFSKEEYIHNLIYPMRKTSDEIENQSHNLWLIDERLAYCEYISSDIPFNNDSKEKRTDILFLDQPTALSDETNHGKEFESIIVMELKRPMRNDYSAADNPINQLLGYVDKLASNTVCDKFMRPIKVGRDTQFYLYAVCDITPTLKKIAETHDFIETPDKRGMYKYHEKKRAYIEILSFDKLIDDAEKRNRGLFLTLGI